MQAFLYQFQQMRFQIFGRIKQAYSNIQPSYLRSAIQLFRHAGKGNICLDTISTNEREDMQTLCLDEFYKKHEDY
ncbi:MAG: hypothetical protein IKA36_05235, partial [Clostridia bacterium]|nr:hypothetical protein [Clostridia bacterium]